MKYEYMVEVVPEGPLQQYLNTMGEHDWRLVAVDNFSELTRDKGTVKLTRMIFEREKA